jgi:hypothetical protein
MSIPKYQAQMLPTKYPITKIQIFRVLQLSPPQKNSVPGIQLDEEIKNFRLHILYDNALIS